jgi:hypothetical protein
MGSSGLSQYSQLALGISHSGNIIYSGGGAEHLSDLMPLFSFFFLFF